MHFEDPNVDVLEKKIEELQARIKELETREALSKELQTALEPFLAALRVNEGDTLSSLSSDDRRLFTTSGSWTGARHVTLGDLRKLAEVVRQETKRTAI